jgi:hypothetical protein
MRVHSIEIGDGCWIILVCQFLPAAVAYLSGFEQSNEWKREPRRIEHEIAIP